MFLFKIWGVVRFSKNLKTSDVVFANDLVASDVFFKDLTTSDFFGKALTMSDTFVAKMLMIDVAKTLRVMRFFLQRSYE